MAASEGTPCAKPLGGILRRQPQEPVQQVLVPFGANLQVPQSLQGVLVPESDVYKLLRDEIML